MCAEFGAIVISSPSISIATSVWNCVEDCAVSVLSNADVSCCQTRTCLLRAAMQPRGHGFSACDRPSVRTSSTRFDDHGVECEKDIVHASE